MSFTEPQEEQVTAALKGHKEVRVRVKGRGEMSPEGRLLRVTKVEKLEIQPVREIAFDESARPIEDILENLASEVPHSEWDRLPADLTDNLDHYLYGTTKAMRTVFADSLYWIAVVKPNDPGRDIAKAARETLGNVRTVTADEVLTEFLAALSASGEVVRRTAAKMVRAILSNPNVKVIPQSRDSFLRGLELYEQRSDKE